jgi:RNA polymerase sigma factor (sigma-70 family)
MTSTAHEHAALVAAVAERRDRQSFTILFDFYVPRITTYFVRLGCDRAAAEELTQDVMVTLWRKADLFDPTKSSLATWLYRIARNRRIDVLRRDRVETVDPGEFLLDVPDDTSPDVNAAIDAQSKEEVLRDALEALPAEHRSLVAMAFYEGLSHSEIATRTGLPLGTVKSRIRLSFTKLRRALEAGGVVEAT